ncbi:MAG: TIGR03943 family putative permease subunit [Bacillota bacterium]
MYIQLRQAIKALILLMFAAFIFILQKSGEITRFIHPSYLYFSQIASVIFLFLFFIQVPRIFRSLETKNDHSQCGPWGCNHDLEEDNLSLKSIFSIGIITLPLLTGLLIPYKIFGAEEALKRGISYSGIVHNHSDEQKMFYHLNNRVQEMMNKPVLYFNKESFASYIGIITTYPEVFIGKQIELEGFIVEDELFSKKHTVIARFLVTHCVADAHASGLVIKNGASFEIHENAWVRIKGVLSVKKDDHLRVPVINVSSLEKIQPPKDPYVYP